VIRAVDDELGDGIDDNVGNKDGDIVEIGVVVGDTASGNVGDKDGDIVGFGVVGDKVGGKVGDIVLISFTVRIVGAKDGFEEGTDVGDNVSFGSVTDSLGGTVGASVSTVLLLVGLAVGFWVGRNVGGFVLASSILLSSKQYSKSGSDSSSVGHSKRDNGGNRCGQAGIEPGACELMFNASACASVRAKPSHSGYFSYAHGMIVLSSLPSSCWQLAGVKYPMP